jgi:hypothetical protein
MFGGRLRIRFSSQLNAWQVEQKVGRADGMPDRVVDDDEKVRARDGYHFILTITTGTQFPCEKCHTTLHRPAFRSGYVTCPHCGRPHVVGYFPLSDSLIDHLKSLDPERRSLRDLARDIDQRNRDGESRIIQAKANQVVSGFDDDYRRIFQIPMTGYTGRSYV